MIDTMLTISTAHLKPRTRNLMDTFPNTPGYGLTVYNKDGFGWFIYLADPKTLSMDDLLKDYPDLHACVKTALSLGVDILCLDSDGSEFPGLPVYEGD